jgi:hypothetical protein
MIAAEIMSFKGDDEARVDSLLVELTDASAINGKHIEIAFNHGKERIYLQFRLSDLLREVKEAKTSA